MIWEIPKSTPFLDQNTIENCKFREPFLTPPTPDPDRAKWNTKNAHTNASYKRGLNENAKRLIRQYFPKNIDLRIITDDDINRNKKGK